VTPGRPASSLRPAEVVISLLQQFEKNRRDVGRRLSELLEKDPVAFQEAAISYVVSSSEAPGAQFVLWLLHKHDLLLDLLLNPRLCTLGQAIQVGRAAKEHIEYVDIGLAKRLKGASEPQAMRILRLLAAIADNNRTLPLLIQIFRSQSADLRAKAARIFSRYCQNTLFTENMLEDPDPEVRASAVEGLGLSGQRTVPQVLLSAGADQDPRVQVHALLARYRLGDVDALDQLKELAAETNQDLRLNAIWALGETRDPLGLPALEALKEHPSTEVRWAVQSALENLQPEGGAAEADEKSRRDEELDVEITRAARQPGGAAVLQAYIIDSFGSVVSNLRAEHFSVSYGGQQAPGLEVVTPQSRGVLTLAFVLDRSGSMSTAHVREMNSAVSRAIESKQPRDRIGLYKFSMDVERASEFTTLTRPLRVAVERRHAGLRSASRLHDAIAKALDDLSGEEGARAVIAVADGADRGSNLNASSIVQKAREKGVPVHIIGFNAGPDEERLREIAEGSQGLYFPAQSGRALTSACQDLLRWISSHYEIHYRLPEGAAGKGELRVQSPVGRAGIRIPEL